MAVPTMRGSRGRLGGGGFVKVAVEVESTSPSSSRGAKVMYRKTLGTVSIVQDDKQEGGVIHDHEAGELNCDLENSEQSSSTSSFTDFPATKYVSPTGGKRENVANGSDAAEPAQENPPRRQAIAGLARDDFVVLW